MAYEYNTKDCILKEVKYRVTTGKNEKEYSWHIPAIKFIVMKQLV